MNKKKDFEDEMKNLPPFFKEMKQNKSGFSVPENYFESVESSIYKNLDAIGARRKTATPSTWQDKINAVLNSLWQPRFAIAFAGIACVMFMAFWWFIPSKNDQLAIITPVEISEEEAEDFVVANVQDFDLNQLAPENEQDFPTLTQENSEENHDFDEKDIESMLKDMSDEDLEEFL
jgi:hypothetical protein